MIVKVGAYMCDVRAAKVRQILERSEAPAAEADTAPRRAGPGDCVAQIPEMSDISGQLRLQPLFQILKSNPARSDGGLKEITNLAAGQRLELYVAPNRYRESRGDFGQPEDIESHSVPVVSDQVSHFG